jgi:hypothetical protein
VQPGDPLPWHGEHAERVVVPQLGLAGEREPGQILELPAVVRVDPGRLEGPPVVRHVVVRVPQRPAQSVPLQRPQFVDAGPLDGFQLLRTRGAVLHSCLLLDGVHGAGRRRPTLRTVSW